MHGKVKFYFVSVLRNLPPSKLQTVCCRHYSVIRKIGISKCVSLPHYVVNIKIQR